MIKWALFAAALASGFAFGAGCFVGWKTTLKVVDSIDERRKAATNVA